MSKSSLLCLGYGYSAAALAAIIGDDVSVTGTTRSKPGDATFNRIDWADRAAVDQAINEATHILITAPPNAEGDPILLRHHEALLTASPAWVGYLSTTGVYGDRSGDWVDEDSALAPVGERGRRRVDAERAWRETGLPLSIFRLPGIYGPGRSALDRLRAGKARRVVREGQIFSRIHVDDLAQVLRAEMFSGGGPGVYNVADDEPAPPQDVIAFGADLLGIEPPPEIPFESADLSPMARSFYGESKRVCNRRIQEDLGVELKYPNFRVGLRAILEAGY
ncbi:SDR family oxidoreductase [Amaricoccus tamworthensis]|uniref:SDR family oxidoreductase n=1 Tax=Amaricoccus tamworthensis TaxID=57002 RepID=UPI003C7CA500